MPQAERNSRWITVRQPFNYYWPGRTAVTHFSEADLGEHLVKAEVADFAVDGGYATEGKLDGSARSRKGKGRKRAAKKERPAAPDAGSKPPVANESVADADRPAGGPTVDPDAG
jgi:hypothetical protein